jgi:fructose-bisphosphate aldolase class I
LHAAAPEALAGVVFLSGGQTPAQATSRLGEINARGRHGWPLTFSYGRALQQEGLAAWRGELANIDQARAAFARRAQSVSRAAEPTTPTVAGEAVL